MRRRALLCLLGGAATPWPLRAVAQQPGKVARIGYLAANLAASPQQPAAFRQGLRELGWIEGRNIAIEYRDAQGKPERLPALAAELVALRPDVIVAGPTLPAIAASRATGAIPIVFPVAPDPIGSGLVASLARPGGNVTGFSLLASELVGKCLQLLAEAVPGAGLIAVLLNPAGHPGSTDQDMLKQVETAARGLQRRIQVVQTRGPEDFDRAFSEMTRAGVGAMTVLPQSLFNQHRARLVDLAARNRLPVMWPYRDPVDAGGLMSYGANITDLFRRSATYVDKILKLQLEGAKPADLAVEQPTKFELVINLKTAKALGLVIPPLLLAQADEVIE